jgi:hypothetical protein
MVPCQEIGLVIIWPICTLTQTVNIIVLDYISYIVNETRIKNC